MHCESCAPTPMFCRAIRQEAPLNGKLLGNGTDMIRFKTTAATDVTHTELVGFTRIMLDVPARGQSGLQGYKWSQMMQVDTTQNVGLPPPQSTMSNIITCKWRITWLVLTKGKLGQINEALLIAIRCMESKGLAHQVSFEPRTL